MKVFWSFAPIWIIFATAFVVLLLDVLRLGREYLIGAAIGGTLAAIFLGIGKAPEIPFVWQDLMSVSRGTGGLMLVLAGLGGVTLLTAHSFYEWKGAFKGESIYLLLFAIASVMLVAVARDLVILFIALEIVALASYALIAQMRTEEGRLEAGTKYMLLGAFGSATLLMGIAFFYGTVGTTSLDPARWRISHPSAQVGWIISAALMLAGLGFKVACVPFHLYAPDVYQGAPGAISGFLAGLSKAASFLALFAVASVWFPPHAGHALADGRTGELFQNVVRALAVATMVWGTVLGLVQKEVKRILAYSSIAHTGYLLLALFVPGRDGFVALAFYLAVYALMKIGAFAAVSIYEAERGEKLTLDVLPRMRRESPVAAFALAVFLFGLAGMPPTGGFMAKFLLFKEAVGAGEVWLVLVAVLTSVAAAGFYLRMTVFAFFEGEPASSTGVLGVRPGGRIMDAVLFVAALAILAVGIFPGLIRSILL